MNPVIKTAVATKNFVVRHKTALLSPSPLR
jgi:hypothetical protein